MRMDTIIMRALVILAACFVMSPVSSIPAHASGPEEMVIDDVSCDQGSTVTVPIRLAGITSPGCMAIQVNISFNPDVVNVDSVTAETPFILWGDYTSNTQGFSNMILTCFPAVTGDFPFANLELNAVGGPGDTSALGITIIDVGYDLDNMIYPIPVNGTFTINGTPDQQPTVSILSPADNATVSGTVSISGEAMDSDGTVQTVEVSIDRGEWSMATGTDTWTYAWDTSQDDNGIHDIWARSHDGSLYSTEDHIQAYVENIPISPALIILDNASCPPGGTAVTSLHMENVGTPGCTSVHINITFNQSVVHMDLAEAEQPFTIWGSNINNTMGYCNIVFTAYPAMTGDFVIASVNLSASGCPLEVSPLGISIIDIGHNETSPIGTVAMNGTFSIGEEEEDTQPPSVTGIHADPVIQDAGGYVNITCDVTDNVAVDTVTVEIRYPDSSVTNTTMDMGGYWHNGTYSLIGIYEYFIWANDTSGNTIRSAGYGFTIKEADVPPLVNTSYVDDGYTIDTPGWGYDHFKRIQDGIDATMENGTVYVHDGIYPESLEIGRTMYLIGNSSRPMILNMDPGKATIHVSAGDVLIQGFTITNTGGTGIHLTWTGSNTIIAGNTISSNMENGIYVHYSGGNTIADNVFMGNGCGLRLNVSSGNTVYHNNFINNTLHAYDPKTNTWDDGYPSGGNYWSGYTCMDADMDGIGDTTYMIPGLKNHDRYPLMSQWHGKGDVNGDGTVNITDWGTFRQAYRSQEGYHVICDFDNNQVVDLRDLVALSQVITL